MSIHRNMLFRSTAICVCAAVVASGCLLNRSPLADWPKLEPALFCPGDTVTASYDFLTPETCPADARCSSFFPDRSHEQYADGVPGAHHHQFRR